MASERKFVSENIRRVLLKEYFMKETEMAGFGGIDIQRTPMGTRVTLIVERPGMVIGRKGTKIKDLTRKVSEDYGFDNPQIEVQECRDSSSNPQIMAQKLALALERGWHFRRAGHSTLRRIMDSRVKGCQVKLSGKLTGQRHRTEKFKWGNIKFCGEPALTTMDRGYAIAKKKLGLIGVSVDIMREGAVLPDDVVIYDLPLVEEGSEIKEIPADEEKTEEQVEGETPAEEPVEEKAEEKTEEKKEKARSKRKLKREERRKDTHKEESDESSETPVEKVEEPPVEEKKEAEKVEKTEKAPPAEEVKEAEPVKAEETPAEPVVEAEPVEEKSEADPAEKGGE